MVPIVVALLAQAMDPATCPMHAEHTKSKPAAVEKSPYAGRETRPLKAIAEADVAGFLEGRGMGLAMPAELNHFPGPRHVLDLAEPLALTAEQKTRAEETFERMRARALPLAKDYVDSERAVEAFFAEPAPDAARLSALVADAGAKLARLREAHLLAHVEMRALLTPAQVARYDDLRGYGTQEAGAAHAAHAAHAHPGASN